MVTSRATRSIAASTPTTIRAVAATHMPTMRTIAPMPRVCDRAPCSEVKPW